MYDAAPAGSAVHQHVAQVHEMPVPRATAITWWLSRAGALPRFRWRARRARRCLSLGEIGCSGRREAGRAFNPRRRVDDAHSDNLNAKGPSCAQGRHRARADHVQSTETMEVWSQALDRIAHYVAPREPAGYQGPADVIAVPSQQKAALTICTDGV